MAEEQVSQRVRRVHGRRLILVAVFTSLVTVTISLAGALYYWGMAAGLRRSMDQSQAQARSE